MRRTQSGRPLTLKERTFSSFDVRWRDVMPMAQPTSRDQNGWIERVGTLKDQGQEGSCTAASGSKLREMLAQDGVDLSMAYLYERERLIEGDPTSDAGAQLRTTEQVLLSYGVCPEADDPYTASDFYTRLTTQMNVDAANYKCNRGFWCPTLEEILGAVAFGAAVQIGVVVYPSFESAPVTGEMPGGIYGEVPRHRVPMPGPGESILGGHALAVSYVNPERERIGGPNSWGSWGWWTLPYSYFASQDTFMDARAYLI